MRLGLRGPGVRPPGQLEASDIGGRVLLGRGVLLNIKIVAIGKLREKYLRDGVAEYAKRLGAYCRLEIVELQDEAIDSGDIAQMASARAREGGRILKAVKPESWAIALDVKGDMLSSEGLAAYFEELCLHGRSDVTMLLGGASGFAPEVLKRSDFRLSFSPMTFPHQLSRLLLLEQLYRSFKIRRNEPYHLGGD